jgi:general secretion pathway protein L
MSVLKIYISDNWRNGDSACPWIFTDSEPAARSDSAFAAMPKADETALIAPATRVLLLEAKLPKGSGRQLRQALPFAVEDKITTDPEAIHVAAGAARAGGTTTLAVVDKQWLRRVLDALRSVGIFPQRMIVETLCPALEPGSWALVWRDNEGFVRTGAQSGLAVNSTLELRLALREQPKPQRIIVRPERELPDLTRWSAEIGVPVVAGRRWDWNEADDENINLLQGEFAPKNDRVAKLRPVFILAAAIVALQFALTFYDWARLRAESNQLNAQIEQTFRTAFPDAKVVVDAPLQMQRNLEALRRASGAVEGSDFLPLLADATKAVKNDASLRSVSYEREKLKLDVRLPQSEAAEQLLQALQQNGVSASLDAVNAKEGAVEARYSVARAAR